MKYKKNTSGKNVARLIKRLKKEVNKYHLLFNV